MNTILIDYLKETFIEKYKHSQKRLQDWINNFENKLNFEYREASKINLIEKELDYCKGILQTRFSIYVMQKLYSLYEISDNLFVFYESFIHDYCISHKPRKEESIAEQKVSKQVFEELRLISWAKKNSHRPELQVEFSERFVAQLLDLEAFKSYFNFLQKKLKDYASPEQEHRIKCKANKEEIKNYFFKLTEKQSDLNPILSEEQVIHLLHANFADFNPPKVKIKFKTTNTTQTFLRRFVRAFHLQYTSERSTEAYINLLLENFSIFENNTFESERSNFSK